MTLLVSFIREKLDHYVEPTREGTPKGEPIGLSRVKYEASLFCLYDLQARHKEGLKAVAKTLKISYGLLRKWRTEEGFKKAIQEHVEEFSSVFLDFAQKMHRKGRDDWNQHLGLPLNKLSSEPLPSIVDHLKALSDAGLYSKDLLQAIELKMQTVVSNLPRDDVEKRVEKLAVYIRIMDYLARSRGHKVSPLVKKLESKVKAQLEQLLFQNLRETILKPQLSEEDRKAALVMLLQLEAVLKERQE